MAVLLSTTWSLGNTGGVTSHIWDLAVSFARLGVAAVPYSVADHVPETPIGQRAADRARSFGDADRRYVIETQRGLRAAEYMLREAVRSVGPSIIHAHDVLAASAAARVGVPVVLTVHGPLSRELQMYEGRRTKRSVEFARVIEADAYSKARKIIAVDTGQKDIIVKDFNIAPEKVSVIHNAVDVTVWTAGEWRERSIRVILVPRRLVPKNGVITVIEALGQLRRRGGPTAELWVAGDGPDRAALERATTRLQVETQVRFLGSVPRLHLLPLLRQCDAVAIPSIPKAGVVEATSIAALEAMSVGRPVLASDIGGLAEILEDGATGFLCPPGDIEAWASGLNRVLTARGSELRAVGARARSYVVRTHATDAWAREMLRVYMDADARGREEFAAVLASDHRPPGGV